MNYWDSRYQLLNPNGLVIHGSGLGSLDDAVDKRINLIKKYCENVESILDVGCGDMNVGYEVINLFPHADYVGLDNSKFLIESLRKQEDLDFRYIETSKFKIPSDLVICFDVLYHIMDDKEYYLMLQSLKDSWTKYLIIITDNKDGNDEDEGSDYMKKRIFNPEFFSKDYVMETDMMNKLEVDSSTAMYIFKK